MFNMPAPLRLQSDQDLIDALTADTVGLVFADCIMCGECFIPGPSREYRGVTLVQHCEYCQEMHITVHYPMDH